MASVNVFELPVAQLKLGPRSLQQMSLRVAFQEISSIFDLGDLPFSIAEPILDHVEDPYQLAEIAENSPQIAIESDKMNEKQKALLDKKFPRWTKKYPVDETMDYLAVHDHLLKAKAREDKLAVERLKSSMSKAQAAKEANKTTIIGTQLGAQLASTLPQPGRKSWGRGGGGGSKPASPLDKIRRQVKKSQKALKTTVPNPLIPNAKSQISHAPAGMIQDHVFANRRKTFNIIPPKRSSRDELHEGYNSLKVRALVEREARLNAAKLDGSASESRSNSGAAPTLRHGASTKRAQTDDSDASASAAGPARDSQQQREARLLAAKTKRPASDDDVTGPEMPSKRLRLDVETITSTEQATSISPLATILMRSGVRPRNTHVPYVKPTIRYEKVVVPTTASNKSSTKMATTAIAESRISRSSPNVTAITKDDHGKLGRPDSLDSGLKPLTDDEGHKPMAPAEKKKPARAPLPRFARKKKEVRYFH